MRRFLSYFFLLLAGCGAWGGNRTATQSTKEPDLDYPVGEFALAERGGKTITDKDLRGQVWVGSFIFTRCNGPCPAVTSSMQRLQTELAPELQSGSLKLVTFTVDPVHDDRKKLNEYADARGADPKNWLFLTGDEKTIHRLLQEQFKQAIERNLEPGATTGDAFNHGTRLVIVDKQGVIRAMYEGLPNEKFPDGKDRFEAGVTRLKDRVRELLREETRAPMNADRAALGAAISANPEDDTPRLVCADWFQEQGDEASVARAEFIRTQVERANLAPTHPRQSELQARELRLLRQHGATWTGSHFAFKKCRFRRGFIEYVHLHLTHFLHHRRQLLALEPVRDVSLTGWLRAKDDLVARLAACEEWKHIHTLRFHHQGPHKEPRSSIVTLIESPHLTNLRSLRLPHISITAEAKQRLERAPVLSQLRELTLPELDNWPDDAGDWFEDGGAVPPWENIRVLRLYDNSPDIIAHLAPMPFWNHIEELDVAGGGAIHDHLPDSLRVLRLRDSWGYRGDAAFWERVAQLPLRGLHIRGSAIDAGSLAHVLSPASRCELQELTLAGCLVSDEHADAPINSERVGAVWSLDLSENGNGPLSILGLFVSEHLRSVARLNLNGLSLEADDVEALADTGWGLQSLEMSAFGVPVRVLHQLFDSSTLSDLVSLSLSGGYADSHKFPVGLAEQLAALPHLAYLKLEGFRPDAEAREALELHGSLMWLVTESTPRDGRDNFEPDCLPPLDEALRHVDQHS